MRLPFTLWRHMLVELWRVLALTFVVLLTVITFAVAVKPLADGEIGPIDVLEFMVLAILPMSQYALPFAAGFAATLAYHRMAQDNEIVAARASAIGYVRLLVPAMLTGIALFAGLIVLTFQTIPGFLASMDRLLADDLTRIMVRQISEGRALDEMNDNVLLRADRAVQMGPDPESGAFQRVLLTGVVAVETDDDGSILSEVTARQAWAWFFEASQREMRERGIDAESAVDIGSQGAIVISIRLIDFVGVSRDEGYVQGERADLDPVVWPRDIDDSARFLTFRELREAKRNPDSMNVIDMRRRDLAHHIAERETTESIARSLAERGRVRFAYDQQRALVLHARSIRWTGAPFHRWEISPPPGKPIIVELVPIEGDQRRTRITAATAGLKTHIGADLKRRHMTLRLDLEGAIAVPTVDVGGVEDAIAPSGGLSERSFRGLELAQNPLPDLLQLSSTELLAKARLRTESPSSDAFIIKPQRDLEKRLAKLERQILASRHERIALPVACLVMVLTGAIMALRLKDSLPLTVYLWSFFPALLAVLTIGAGEQMVVPLGHFGLIMLWGGVGVLILVTAVSFRRLAAH